LQDVGPIDARGNYLDQDFALSGRRHWLPLRNQNFGPARLADRDAGH